MLSLRNRFGIPGVISVLALVFALVGGAYAANGDGGAGASAKKNNRAKKKKGVTVAQVRRIAKQEARKFANSNPGLQGPAGLPGAQGPKGDKGSKGSTGNTGSKGDAGESVTVAAYTGPQCAEASGESGAKLSNGSGTAYACNGADGGGGAGGTQTGVYGTPTKETAFGGASGWGSMDEGETYGVLEADFTAPLAAEPTFVFVPGVAAGFGSDEGEGCPGVVEGVPTADAGTFCVYGYARDIGAGLTPSAAVTTASPAIFGGTAGVTKTGTLLVASCEDGGLFELCYSKGVWAVTG